MSPEKTCRGTAKKVRSDPEKFHKMANKKAERHLNRFLKKLDNKAEKMLLQIDFVGPVEKWLWLGILGLGIAIAFSILGLEVLSGLCIMVALACLLVWKIKRALT